MSGDYSSSTFHDFQEFIILIIKISDLQIFESSNFEIPQIEKSGTQDFGNFEKSILRFPWKILSHMFPRMFPDFLGFFKVFWCNKMKKYGLPEPKTLIIHEMLTSRPIPVDGRRKKIGFFTYAIFFLGY